MVDKLCPTVRTTSFLASILRQTLCKFLLHHKNAYALSHCQANTMRSITPAHVHNHIMTRTRAAHKSVCRFHARQSESLFTALALLQVALGWLHESVVMGLLVHVNLTTQIKQR